MVKKFLGIYNADAGNVLVQGIVQKKLKEWAPRYIKGRLLDIGCGEKPYQEMLAPYTDEHVGLDHPGTLHEKSNIDLSGTAYDIPADEGSFDSVLCTAVLEHLEEPERALKECLRVLKPGGVAVYSIPFIWHIHEEPRDFYRFSRYGIDYIFNKAGFDLLEVQALSGFWVTFGQLFTYNIRRMSRGPLKWLRIMDVLSLLIQGAAYMMDRLDGNERWTWMYMVAAKKRDMAVVLEKEG